MRERLPGYQRQRSCRCSKSRCSTPSRSSRGSTSSSSNGACRKAREYLGADDPDTKLILGKESPEGLAARLVAGTRLADPALSQGAVEWRQGRDRRVERSDDRLCPPARRALPPAPGRSSTSAIMGPVTAAQAKLADARFAAYGDTLYPDATFTLRISYGKVAGLDRARPARCRRSHHRSAGPSTARPAPIRSTCRPRSSQRGAGSTRTSSMTSSPPTTSSAAIPARR